LGRGREKEFRISVPISAIEGSTVKRATIAVAHAQLIALYWVLRNGVPYQQQRQELDCQQRESLIRHHLHRVTQLGYTA